MIDLIERHSGIYSMVVEGELSTAIQTNGLEHNPLVFKLSSSKGATEYLDTFQVLDSVVSTLEASDSDLCERLRKITQMDFSDATQTVRDLYQVGSLHRLVVAGLENILQAPELSIDVFGHVRSSSQWLQLCPTSGAALTEHPWLCVCFALLYACHPLACAALVMAVSDQDPSALERGESLPLETMAKCLDPDRYPDTPKLQGHAYTNAYALVRDYFLNLELSPRERRMLDLIPDNDLVNWATDDVLVDFVRVAGYCYALEV